jgi:EmrB/QacA subfamily drug resistance transporter
VTSAVRARRFTLLATGLGSALAFLDATVVIVALPRMDVDLGLGLTGQQWVVLGYALALSALLLVGGAVGDRFGLRRTFGAGVVVFAVASLACAVAPEAGLLVAARALQGVGAAALTTTSLALLRVVWAEDAGRAIGLWTSLTAVATVAGPPLGGLLVEFASWRWIFIINVPLAVVVVALAAAGRTEDERPPADGRLDVVGSLLAAVGLAGLTFALVEARQGEPAVVLVIGAVGVAALAGLVVWTLRSRAPLVPPRLLRRPGLSAANAATLAIYAALGATFFFVPVYLQFLGLSPTLASLAFVPPSIALILLAPRFGRYADRNGPRRPVTAGALGIAASALLLLPVDDRAAVWAWGGLSVVTLSLSLAVIVAPITAAALSPAPGDLAGVASGLNQTVARVGGVLSVAGIGVLAGWVYEAQGGEAAAPFESGTFDAFAGPASDAFRVAILCIVLLAALGAAISGTKLAGAPAEAPSGGARIEVEPAVSPCPPAGPGADAAYRSAPSRRSSSILRSSPPA